MKKYIFAFLLFLLAIISIDNAFALSSPYWGNGSDLIRPKDVDIFDCSSTACDYSLTPYFQSVDSSQGIYYYSNDSLTSMTANGNGIMWVYQLDNFFKSGYLYSLTTYLCHSAGSDIIYKNIYTNTYSAGVQSLNTSPQVFQSLYLSTFNTTVYPGIAFQKCGFVNTIIKPSNNAKFVGLRTTTSGNATNYKSYLIGYTVDALGDANGLSTSDIQNVINSSGLASSSDINDLNSAISVIQSELSDDISDAESNIITSQERTRDAIINNQNENTNREIESQQVCNDTVINYDSASIKNTVLNGSDGSTSSNQNYNTTDFLPLTNTSTLTLTSGGSVYLSVICFYNSSKTFISCTSSTNLSVGSSVPIPANSSFARFTIYKIDNVNYSLKSCKNGNQALDDSINDLNGKITDSAVTGGIGSLAGWFDNFNTDTFGLTSVITSPLNLISSLTSKTCSPLHLQIPFINQTMDLPCMTTIYSNYFGTFLTLYQTITFGITSYWVCVRLFNLVKDFKNPDHDEIEVMDL